MEENGWLYRVEKKQDGESVMLWAVFPPKAMRTLLGYMALRLCEDPRDLKLKSDRLCQEDTTGSWLDIKA